MKRLNILGVCNANVSGATLIKNNKIVAAVSEERFTRIKNDRSFPQYSINYVLNFGKVKISDIDIVSCGAWKIIDEEYIPEFTTEIFEWAQNVPESKNVIIERIKYAVTRDMASRDEIIEEMTERGASREKIRFYDHHTSHAYLAFYCSPFNDAMVLTMDGRGDFKSITLSLANRKDGLKIVDSVSLFNSLGFFYSYITKYLGFTPDRHEGKVTGLAAYGDAKKTINVLKKIINYHNGKIISGLGKYFMPYIDADLPNIAYELKQYSREDIAAGTQALLEEITLEYLKPFLKKYRSENICLGGGVLGNVLLNKKIHELPGVKNTYVFPQMGDGGNATGGALISLIEEENTFQYPLKNVYLGPSYSNTEIKKEIDKIKGKVNTTTLKKYTLKKVAEDITNDSVVGFFKGRMEFGPRALGARSILAQATDPKINETLNKRLHRTEFMPFAPVTLIEYAKDYYLGWKKDDFLSRFMTICYDCTPRAKKETPAIAHIDGTARPQVIERKDNPLYYDLVNEYQKLTGIPTLINTSFNNHEEPIVCSPRDALSCLFRNNIDYLVIEDFVIFDVK